MQNHVFGASTLLGLHQPTCMPEAANGHGIMCVSLTCVFLIVLSKICLLSFQEANSGNLPGLHVLCAVLRSFWPGLTRPIALSQLPSVGAPHDTSCPDMLTCRSSFTLVAGTHRRQYVRFDQG